MNEFAPAYLHLTILLSFGLGLSQCDRSNFDKGSVTSATASPAQVVSSNDSAVEEDDGEAYVASEPVAIGGAFLNCLRSPADSSPELEGIRCEFSSKDLDSLRAKDLAYSFTTGANRTQTTQLSPSREEVTQDAGRQTLIFTFIFQKSLIRDGWLFVDIQDKARVLDPIIKAEVAIPLVEPAPTPTTTPAPAALVRFNSGAQKLGDDGIAIAVEPACINVDLPGIAFARSQSYSITLTTDTTLNLAFSNLCGVGTGQVNTAGSFTTAVLKNSSNATVFQFNLSSGAKLNYVSPSISAGLYTLVITPASRDGALNDFAYSNLMIEGTGITVK